jgi:hypothetical protein
MAGDAGGGVPPKSDPYEACAVERIEKSRGNACAMFSGQSPAISDIAIFSSHLTKPQRLQGAEQALCEGGTGSPF